MIQSIGEILELVIAHLCNKLRIKTLALKDFGDLILFVLESASHEIENVSDDLLQSQILDASSVVRHRGCVTLTARARN